ncbi:MAG TPA: 4-(cytidine 5'-diphospho)-2-C-methyl-D-erythritol kinase [Allosphingosinicella sp.]|jgi:4-diphosphocytidyl-2-C-methyl-D-erythritol kinase
MEEIAYAKVNLELRVRARRPDGYHEVDTLFAFAEDGDRLSVGPAEELGLQVTGPFAAALGAPEDNLVLRAARLLGEGRGAALTLDKRLPVASGIGGGSADAAAALRLLVRWWGLRLGRAELLALARHLGADVPACLESRIVRGTGRGDHLAPDAGPEFRGDPILLVNPGVPVATADVFGRWKGASAPGSNDLEPPAREIAPVIGEVVDRLGEQPGVRMASMSGSGATCFALFDSDEALGRAASAIAARHPHWWQLASRLR